MRSSTEEMLRDHFAARMRRLEIPEPEPGSPLDRAVAGLPVEADEAAGDLARIALPGAHRTRRLLAAAAVVVVIAAVAGVALARGDGKSKVSTDPTPVPTTTVPPTTAAPPEPTTTTAPPPPPPTTSVVVGAHGPVGGWTGSAWWEYELGEPFAGVGAQFTLVHLDEPLTTTTGRVADGPCAGPRYDEVDAGTDGLPFSVAVSGVADPRPRPVEVLDPADPVLRQAAVVAASGLVADPSPTVTQAVRADLDGDGSQETVVAAEHTSEGWDVGYAVPGGFAVVFVMHGGDPADTTLVSSRLGDPSLVYYRFTVSALADLNGDGRMEIALYNDYPEGWALSVYATTSGGGWDEVLFRPGC